MKYSGRDLNQYSESEYCYPQGIGDWMKALDVAEEKIEG